MQTADLSNYHHSIGQLFAGETFSSGTVSSADLDFFKVNGYLAGTPLLGDEQIDTLRSDLDDLMRPENIGDRRFYEYNHNESANPERVLFHALGAWRVSPAFHDLIFYRPIVLAAERLLGGPVRFWHDQLFVKPAHDGAVVAWHQDYSYWTRTKPIAHLTCWIGLDDSTTQNGCVHYIPGSHCWPLLPRTGLAGDMDAVLGVLTEKQRAMFKPVPVKLRAGEASFHHPMMLHGSYENRSAKSRRAAVINFFLDGTISGSDEPLLDGVPVIGRGCKIEGRHFPLLSATNC